MQSYAQRHTKNPRLSRALSHVARILQYLQCCPGRGGVCFGALEVGPKRSEGLWPLPSLPSSLPPWTVCHGSPASESRLFWMVACLNQIHPRYSWALVWGYSPQKTDFQRGFVTGDEQTRPAGISARCQRCKNTFPQVPNPTLHDLPMIYLIDGRITSLSNSSNSKVVSKLKASSSE